ncbi:MAG TPA: serine hydrolase [Chitinophagaceae bacterium]|nr:serine hydrolase [Chitinophagaceae bacterium]
MTYKNSFTCIKGINLFAVLLLLQSVLQSVVAQKKSDIGQQKFPELDDIITQQQKLLGKDFVVMLWKKDDTLVYKKELGDFNSKTQAPIASCSKWLTAALVMTFIDEGKLSLDDKITKWLPEFEKYGKNYITIRTCLSHMTGIKSEPISLLKLLERKKFSNLEDEVNSFAAKDIQANPGDEFRYSNIGLDIAGRVLEIISKKRFDVLARQRLFVPLQMRRTSFSSLDGSAVNPSGGAYSSPDDYMHFLIMLMNKGVYQGNRILSEKAVNDMLTIQTTLGQIRYAPKAAEGYNYALGAWAAEAKDGKATAVTSPGLFGSWPMIDYCRGYAYLFFVKDLLSEDKADAQMEIKAAIDEKFPSTCK